MNAYKVTTTATGDDQFLVIAPDPTAATLLVTAFHAERGWDDYAVINIELVGATWPSPRDVPALLLPGEAK